MEHRKDEEEYIYKIKQSIYQSNEVGSRNIQDHFVKSIANCSGFSLYIFIFIVQQPWLDDNKSPVQSSTQIKPKTKDESAQDPTLKQFMNDLYQSTNAKMKLTCIKR